MTTLLRPSVLSVVGSLLLLSATARAADNPAPEAPGTATTGNQEIQHKLSILWTVVALNMIGADVLSSYIPGKQEEVVRFAGGERNVKYYMLAGALAYEIPISMVFLSRYLPRNANRWTNVAAAVLSAGFIVGGGSTEPHYIFAASVELLTLSYITWTSLRWPDDRGGRVTGTSGQALSCHLRPDGGAVSYSFRF